MLAIKAPEIVNTLPFPELQLYRIGIKQKPARFNVGSFFPYGDCLKYAR